MMLVTIGLILSVLCAAVTEEVSALRCVIKPNDHNMYRFDGGDLADLDAIPSNAENILIIGMNMNNFIPNDTFYNFRNHLLGLFIWDSNVDDIAPDAFRGLNKLVYLSLQNNRLTTIKDTWFERMSDYLCDLSFVGNPIQYAELNFIDSAPRLKNLQLGGTKLDNLDNITGIKRREELLEIIIGEGAGFKCSKDFASILREKNSELVYFEDSNDDPVDWFKDHQCAPENPTPNINTAADDINYSNYSDHFNVVNI